MAIALALSIVLLTAELAAGVSVRQRIDQHRAVTDQRLRVALLTFRPSERAGMPNDVTAAELTGENQVRTVPGWCSALSLLAVAPPEAGQSWTGINGSPAEPVRTLTVRYAQASSARQAIRQKRLALARCRKVSLIFPPFDEPPQDFSVSGRSRPSNAVGETPPVHPGRRRPALRLHRPPLRQHVDLELRGRARGHGPGRGRRRPDSAAGRTRPRVIGSAPRQLPDRLRWRTTDLGFENSRNP